MTGDNFHFDLGGGVPMALCLQVAYLNTYGKPPVATHWAQFPRVPEVVFKTKESRDAFVAANPKWPHTYGPRALPARLVLFKSDPGSSINGLTWEVRHDRRPDLSHDWPGLIATVHPFPGKGLTQEAVEPFVKAWLESADYGNEPDHDGSNGRSWRFYCEGWGHVIDYHGFCAIEPQYVMYGK